ncbi:MAG: hypothetical protein WC851_03485 [Candidatus Shapirobacteria bacterium]|jgi:hypothetical protein
MGALSLPELQSLQDDYAQVSMVAGMNPHYVEKMDLEKGALLLGQMSEEMGAALLAPTCAAELLDDLEYLGDVPETLLDDLVLRQKANEVARQIDQITEVDAIPILCGFVGGLDLDRLDKRDKLADIITEKVAILSVHKIIELVAKNGGSVEYELPEQVTTYIETIRNIKGVMYLLASISETHKILEFPLQGVVNADTKWTGQDEMEEVVKIEEESHLASQVFRIITNDNSQFKRAIKTSQVWAKEGLDESKVPRLTKEQVARFLKIGVRYFTWYSLLDEKWTGEAEDKYFDNFQVLLNTFRDTENPNYLGNTIPRTFNDSIANELAFADTRLFTEETEN